MYAGGSIHPYYTKVHAPLAALEPQLRAKLAARTQDAARASEWIQKIESGMAVIEACMHSRPVVVCETVSHSPASVKQYPKDSNTTYPLFHDTLALMERVDALKQHLQVDFDSVERAGVCLDLLMDGLLGVQTCLGRILTLPRTKTSLASFLTEPPKRSVQEEAPRESVKKPRCKPKVQSAVRDFVQTCLESANASSVVSTQDLKAAFIQAGNAVSSDSAFFQELQVQLADLLPGAERMRSSKFRGYRGLRVLKQRGL